MKWKNVKNSASYLVHDNIEISEFKSLFHIFNTNYFYYYLFEEREENHQGK